MTDIKTAEEAKPKVPAAAIPKLRDAWLRAYGAAQSAEAARQVSNQMFGMYQQQLGAYMDILGLDSKKQWWLDFETGELNDTPPPDQQQGQQNGVVSN